MSKKEKLRFTKKILHQSLIIVLIYILILLLLSAIIQDNPELVLPGVVVANDIKNPFGDEIENDTLNYFEKFKQFEGFVIVASATETNTHDLHLMALPGQRAKLYRNFTIFMFSNMPCYYEIKIDDQVFERGYFEWKASVKSSSPYNTLDISVRLINETNVSLPGFNFIGMELLDSPWEVIEEGEGPAVIEEWIRMTRGEFTTWVIKMILMQIAFGFIGAVGGTGWQRYMQMCVVSRG